MDLNDYFIDRPYRIECNDCISVMKSLPDDCIDLVLTDPPYNLGLFMKSRATNLKAMRPNFFGSAGWDDLGFDDWKESMDSLFKECSRISKYGASMICFMSVIKVETVIQIAEKHGFYYKTTGIWHKLNPMPRNMNLHFINSTEAWLYFTYQKHTGTFNNGGKAIHDFVETPVASAKEKKCGRHPTQKPVALMERFVKLLSNEGDIIFDPFMGAGGSGVASVSNGRKFIGTDINAEYCNIAEKRLNSMYIEDT